MLIRIAGFLGTLLVLYVIGIRIAGQNSDKVYIKLNKFFKYLFGFFAYGGYRFGLKSVIFQGLNITAILVYSITFITSKNINLSVEYSSVILIANVIITGIISIISRR